jgi:hypothetical protein
MSDPFKFTLEQMLAWCEPDARIIGHGPDEMKRAIAKALKAGVGMQRQGGCMSIEERHAYGQAVDLIERHGMMVIAEEQYYRLLAVVEAARKTIEVPFHFDATLPGAVNPVKELIYALRELDNSEVILGTVGLEVLDEQ